MLERTSRIVRRIDINALHLPGEFLFQRLESEQIVPADEHVVEDVARMIGSRSARRVLPLCVLCVLVCLTTALFAATRRAFLPRMGP